MQMALNLTKGTVVNQISKIWFLARDCKYHLSITTVSTRVYFTPLFGVFLVFGLRYILVIQLFHIAQYTQAVKKNCSLPNNFIR